MPTEARQCARNNASVEIGGRAERGGEAKFMGAISGESISVGICSSVRAMEKMPATRHKGWGNTAGWLQ
jgi:hypothetical protein